MTKIWMKEVFERSNLNQSLTESFLRILNNHRDKNVRTALNNNHFNDKSLDSFILISKSETFGNHSRIFVKNLREFALKNSMGVADDGFPL